MTTTTQIEQRLKAVEKAVSELQHQLANLPSSTNWLEQIAGTFKDEPAFEEVLKFGRAIRSADRLLEDTGDQA